MVKIKRKCFIIFICIFIIVSYRVSPTIVRVQGKTSTSNSKVPVIVIDPGHGGYDSGAVGSSGTEEKNAALQVALKLGKLLQNQHIKIVYTRNSDKISWPSNQLSSLMARTQISNSANADYYISIHCNYVNYKKTDGAETYYCSGSTSGKRLAESVQKELIKSTKLPDRGIKSANYYVLKNTDAPAILAELGFISNPREESNLSSPKYQDKLASAIYTGIMKGIKKK